MSTTLPTREHTLYKVPTLLLCLAVCLAAAIGRQTGLFIGPAPIPPGSYLLTSFFGALLALLGGACMCIRIGFVAMAKQNVPQAQHFFFWGIGQILVLFAVVGSFATTI